MNILPQSFYERDPKIVAIDLLGKTLVRTLRGIRLAGIIVETEAYYGKEDPASRARKGGKLAEIMYGEAGYTLIYGVHGNWLLNITTCPKGIPGAVLIRAIEPIEGVDFMMKLRNVKKLEHLTSGPGKLTKALSITKSENLLPVFSKKSCITIEMGREIESSMIGRSHRIGVREDLEEPLRFYIRDNPFVSKTSLRL